MLGPVAFQQQVLRRNLWSIQQEICNAIATTRSVAIKGCHGSGKTYLVAGMVPYELLSDPECIVLTLAPTLRQVKTHWNEVNGAINSLPFKIPEPSTTMWKLSDKSYAQGFSSSKGVNAQGFHGRRVLIIADEAIGIIGDVWDAIEGIRAAGEVRIVTLCNPTVPSGPVFDSFTKGRSQPGHKTFTISAFDTPNLAGLNLEELLRLPDADLDHAPFPWLTRRRWVVEMFHKWGPQNPRFQARVMGEFPQQASDAVFQLAWIEAAAAPYEPEELNQYRQFFIQVGMDVAGPGNDETAVCARIGSHVVATDSWVKADPLDEVLQFLGRLRQRFRGAPIVILGDAVGVGYHFLRSIAREQFDVREFMAGAAPVDGVKFKNAKAEAYWQLREWMQEGHVHGVTDEDTKAQLSAVIYRETARGLIEIEPKKEALKRGVASPDRAEALVMAFTKLVPKEQTTVFNQPGAYQISPV